MAVCSFLCPSRVSFDSDSLFIRPFSKNFTCWCPEPARLTKMGQALPPYKLSPLWQLQPSLCTTYPTSQVFLVQTLPSWTGRAQALRTMQIICLTSLKDHQSYATRWKPNISGMVGRMERSQSICPGRSTTAHTKNLFAIGLRFPTACGGK